MRKNVLKTTAVGLGMSEDGTADIGMGAGLPAGGLYAYTETLRESRSTQEGKRSDPHGQKVSV